MSNATTQVVECEWRAYPHVCTKLNSLVQPPCYIPAAGADGETPSVHHRPPPRAHISWEFDNRDWLRCAAAPAVPTRDSGTKSSSNPSNPGNRKARVGRISTPASSNDDTEHRQEQPGPHRNPDDVGTAFVSKRGSSDGSPRSGGLGGYSEPTAGARIPEATMQKPCGGEGSDGVAGDSDVEGVSRSSGGAEGVVVASDAVIGWESEGGTPDIARVAVDAETTTGSHAAAKARTTPPGFQRSGSVGGAEEVEEKKEEEEGKEEKEKEEEVAESGLLNSVRSAASVDSFDDGGIGETGLEGPLGDDRDCDGNPGDLRSTAEVGDVGRINTTPRLSRGRRGRDESEDEAGGHNEGCGGSGEDGCRGKPTGLVRGRQEEDKRSRSKGEEQRTPRQAPRVPQQLSVGLSGGQDGSETGEGRACKKVFAGTPTAAAGGNTDSASVWSSSGSSSSDSCSGGSTGRNSPIQSNRGSPKTVGETKASFQPSDPTRRRDHRQEKTTSAARECADRRDYDRSNGTVDKGSDFTKPLVPNQSPSTEKREHDIGDDGIGGGDDGGGSVGSSIKASVVKPTNKTAHDDPVPKQNNGACGVESRRSKGYRETVERRGGGREEKEGGTVGDSRTLGQEESASPSDEDEYGSDFASQVPELYTLTICKYRPNLPFRLPSLVLFLSISVSRLRIWHKIQARFPRLR